MKLSIIVPVYNVEEYLPRCLDSLITENKDYEIIVVNDGSPDNSEKIIKDYKKRYPNLIKSCKKKNGGLSSARNFGLKKAQGDFVWFVDSDDFVQDGTVDKLLTSLNKRVDALIFNGSYWFGEGKTSKIDKLPFNGEVVKVEEFMNELFSSYKMETKLFVWRIVYKRDKIDKLYEEGNVIEDIIFNIDYFQGNKKVRILDENLYNYNQTNMNSLTKNKVKISQACLNTIEVFKNRGYEEYLDYLYLFYSYMNGRKATADDIAYTKEHISSYKYGKCPLAYKINVKFGIYIEKILYKLK